MIEAGEYSGTRVTARCALEQGRDVFAVPGNVTNKLSWGPNTLIKQGAALVATWEDVWEALACGRPAGADPAGAACIGEAPQTASLFQRGGFAARRRRGSWRLLRADESTHIDQIVERLVQHLSSSEIFTALFELELAAGYGVLPGKYYVRVL